MRDERTYGQQLGLASPGGRITVDGFLKQRPETPYPLGEPSQI